MNEPKPNTGTPEKASSLHEVDVPLVELERRMNEARDKCSRAYWMNRTWSIVERLMDEYADARCAYGAAKERHIQLIDQLVTEGGAIVSSGDCSTMEIADAQAHGRFSVRDDGMGFVRRTKEWLDLQLAREKAHPNTDGRYSWQNDQDQMPPGGAHSTRKD